MRRYSALAIALLLIFSFTGCSRDTQSVILLTKSPETDVPDTETASADTEFDREYVVNVSSKKIHLSSCASVSQMKPENRKEFSGDVDTLLADGYSFCNICFKEGAAT